MCTTKTAIRRRKQSAKGYRHMAPMKRPRYKIISREKSQQRLARLRELAARGIKV